MVVRLTPASLDDGMPMNAWQRRRNLEAAGLTALADPDSGFAPPRVSDSMAMAEWQRARGMQVLGGDVISGGGGDDGLAGGVGRDRLGLQAQANARPTLRPGQVGSARQAEVDGDIAAGRALGGLADGAKQVVAALFGSRAAPLAQPSKPNSIARPEPASVDPKHVAAKRYGAGAILRMISKGEGTDRPDGYDITFGYGRYNPPGTPRLTSMTLDEVAQLQDEMLRRGSPNTPVGKYEMTKDTLNQFRGALKLSGSEKFTPELQDRLAREILFERGYDDFLQGKITALQFQARLAKRWDGLSDLDGHPYSDRNKSIKRQPNVSNQDVQTGIKAANDEFNQMFDDGRLPEGPGGWR